MATVAVSSVIENPLYFLVHLGRLNLCISEKQTLSRESVRFSKAEDVFSPLLCFLGLWKKQLQCLWFMPLLIMLWWFEVV